MAGQPARAAAAHRGGSRREPDLPAARAAQGGPGALGAVPVRPGAADGRTRRRRDARVRRAGGLLRLLASPPLLGGVVMLLAGAAAAGSAVRRNGCWWAGSGPASTRCGAPSSGATRSWTPSSRWSAPRGSRALPPGHRPWCGGCAALGAKIGRGAGAKATGCPRRTWSPSATELHGQPRMRRPDPSVPRPCHEHRHCYARRRRHHGPARRHSAAGEHRPRRHRGAGVARHARAKPFPPATYWMGNPVSPWDGPAPPGGTR